MAARNKPAGRTKTERDLIALGRIEAYIDDKIAKHLQCPSCKKAMDPNELRDIPPGVVSLMKARYDKLRPSLQAVEQTIIDPRDKADPVDLESKLTALFNEKPGALERFIAIAFAAATPELRARLREQLADKVVH